MYYYIELENPYIFDFISPLRISLYHYIIIKENKRYNFLDIMDNVNTCYDDEIQFNDLEMKYPECYFHFDEDDLLPTKNSNTYRTINRLDSKFKKFIKFIKHPKESIKKGSDNLEYRRKVITKASKLEEVILDILKNKSSSLLWSKDLLLKKICAYKSMVMRGESLPIYMVHMIGNKVKSFKLEHGEDIVQNMNLEKSFIKTFKKNM